MDENALLSKSVCFVFGISFLLIVSFFQGVARSPVTGLVRPSERGTAELRVVAFRPGDHSEDGEVSVLVEGITSRSGLCTGCFQTGTSLL